MTESNENAAIRKATDAAVEYEGILESYVKDRPLTAIAVSIVVGALLAKFLF